MKETITWIKINLNDAMYGYGEGNEVDMIVGSHILYAAMQYPNFLLRVIYPSEETRVERRKFNITEVLVKREETYPLNGHFRFVCPLFTEKRTYDIFEIL